MAKIGRNDKCPCGSGKKYKKCCLGKDELVFEKRPIRYDFRHLLTYEEVDALSTDEIIDKLHFFGIPFKQEKFLTDVEKYYSAQDLSENWFRKYDVTATGREEDFPWFAAWVLWERLAPAHILSMEQMSELINRGYHFSDKNDPVTACDIWLKVWEAIKVKIKPKMKNLFELDEHYRGSFYVSNFCQDLELELYLAGQQNAAYFEKRITYCREFCHLLPEGSELITHNMRRAIGESYAEIDRYPEAESEFEQLVQDFPDNPWGYIGWGDIFLSIGTRQDGQRAQQLYEKALAIAKDKEDIEIIKERMIDVQEFNEKK